MDPGRLQSVYRCFSRAAQFDDSGRQPDQTMVDLHDFRKPGKQLPRLPTLSSVAELFCRELRQLLSTEPTDEMPAIGLVPAAAHVELGLHAPTTAAAGQCA